MGAGLLRTGVLLVALAVFASSCTDDSDSSGNDSGGSGDEECVHDSYDGDHVLAVLDADGRFDHVICIIEAGADGVRYFTTGDRRLFAPTDDVFAALGDEGLEDLTSGDADTPGRFRVELVIDGRAVTARAVLDHHILGCSPNTGAPSCPPPPDPELQSGEYRNAAGAAVEVEAEASSVRAGDASVIEQFEAANGVIYVVDGFVSLP